jgi:hypothetical protein
MPQPNPPPGPPGPLSRREFFPALAKALAAFSDPVRATRVFSLAELDSLPDDLMARIAPAVNPAFEITVAGGYLGSRDRSTGQARQHFELLPENLYVFNRFDGNHSLAEIGLGLAAENGWEAAAAFAHARALFLGLAQDLVCLPQNSLW